MPSTAIVWFRRDLRVHDHPALTAALEAADQVIPLFVFDEPLLAGRWPSANRTWFMRESVAALSASLAERGGGLRIVSGRPADVVPAIARALGASEVYVTRDAAPYGRRHVADRSGSARRAACG